MNWRFSISSTLALIITIILVSSILIAVSYSYIESEHKLQESFEREKIASEDLFNQSSMYIHGGLKLWASAYNPDLYNNMQFFLDAYNQTGGHPEELNLTEIKSQCDPDIRDKVDLYLINKTGVIEYTTYTSELHYDFSHLNEFYEDLKKIRAHDSFVPDEIVRGVLPGAPLRKFIYHSTYDHQYVAQMSMNVQNISIPERSRLSYASLISYIMKQNQNLEKLHLFSSFGKVTIGKNDYPHGVDNQTRTTVQQVLQSKQKVEYPDIKNHTITSYIFIPHDVDENPSSKYQDLVAKFVFSTSQIEGEITYVFILHLLLAVCACIIAILIAWILSQRIITPINQIIDDIDLIAAGDLNHELGPTRHPELDRVSDAIRTMIFQIRRNIKELENSEIRYRSLFLSSTDAILILQGDIISDANPSAITLFESITRNLVGSRIDTIFSSIRLMQSDGLDSITNLFEFLSRNEEKDITIINTKKEERTYNTRVSQVNIGGEAVTQVQIRDVSKQHEYEEAIKKMNLALEQEVRVRTQDLQEMISELDAFTYTVSHDLRAPLRAIDGFAHIIESGLQDQDPKMKNFLVKIHENIRKMGTLIEDLLRLSRASRKPLQMTAIEVYPMIQDIITELTFSGQYPDVSFVLKPFRPIYGDSGLVRQVFVNLLSNALKFRKPDRMNTITIYSYTQDDEEIFVVQDTGVGFETEYKDSIFDVFTQLDPEKEREGTGAGLAIVKRIIIRHGGSIWVESEKGKGTTFFFTFPSQKKHEDN